VLVKRENARRLEDGLDLTLAMPQTLSQGSCDTDISNSSKESWGRTWMRNIWNDDWERRMRWEIQEPGSPPSLSEAKSMWRTRYGVVDCLRIAAIRWLVKARILAL
jgi:hypothetical protein